MSDIVILGGGPAGAAAAIALARAGRRPLLIEREPLPREKVCGEFYAEDAAAALRRLGLDLPGLGAVPIRRAVFGAGRRGGAIPLPFPAWGLPRARLDAALLETAEAAGAEVRRGCSVSAVEEEATGGWLLRLPGGGRLRARQLVLATGKHDCRGAPRAARGGWLGLKLHLDAEAPEEAVVLLACRGGYAGLQPRPGGGANLCAALRPGTPGVTEAARDARALLAHVAAESDLGARLLAGTEPLWPRPLAVSGVPYGWMHAGGGPHRAGDQMAVIPSLCGDGVAIALATGAGAAGAILAGEAPARHHAAWRRRLGLPMRLAGGLGLAACHAPGLAAALAASLPGGAALVARLTRAAGVA